MTTNKLRLASALLLVAALAAAPAFAQPGGGAGGQARPGGGGGGPPRLAPLLMETTAFADGAIVPQRYAGREGVQPGFTFSNAPEGTVTYAIIFHDIDVALMNGTGDVLHWICWNIPASAKGIPEGKLPEGSVTGKNIAGQNAYFGPGAPPGPRYHHYVFELYALNTKLDLPDTASRPELLKAMEGKIVAKAAYVGRFHQEPPKP
ncbi:MAG TPA: YbhB/YbcL family Raf kinase inhibitor-like protein [Gammaproteobacteria bacterium]|nr:YbhB/YbcL family Raf kinase inhibitor-like protein [Gammaproteobacteria bacterium]